jgi:NAD(P)-dependent dehydrogenase (short-subunit alcohol dehydrogenase family)
VIGNVSALAVSDDEDAWQASFETDMMHSVRLVNVAMPWLEKSSAASIMLVSSVSGREIDFTGPAYGAFKAAIVHYAQGLAYKLAAKGIRANEGHPCQYGITGKYLFRWWHLAKHRNQHAWPLRRGAGFEPHWAYGET